MKKIILALIFLFVLSAASAFETNVQITATEETVPTQEYWHWIKLNWDYTGPLSGTDWRECDFSSPDKNYGIALKLDTTHFYADSLMEEFGPITSTPKCDIDGNQMRCSAETIYFAKLKTKDYPAGQDITLPINLRGKCGVIDDPQAAFPIDMNYNYNFTVNTSYANLVPDINSISRWGIRIDHPLEKSAELKVIAHDPQESNITGFDWKYPSDCPKVSATGSGLETPDANSELSLSCQSEGIKLIVVTATNQEGYTGQEAFFSYFTDNNDEVEFELDYDDFIVLPNSGAIYYEGVYQHFDYRLAKVKAKTFIVLKDTGTGMPEELSRNINIISTPFISIQNSFCPQKSFYNKEAFTGKDFQIKNKQFNLYCLPGNHEINLEVGGKYSNGMNFVLNQDLNFVVPDLNIHVIGMKTTQENAINYGIVFGENRQIDLNIIINNYSPEFIEINDVNLFYLEYTS
ncbi:MAG: hypothetical protein ABIA04_09680, partial [Pseudomonadota bacterium]